jgi:ApaG protein
MAFAVDGGGTVKDTWPVLTARHRVFSVHQTSIERTTAPELLAANAPFTLRNLMAESRKYQVAVSAIPQFIVDQSDPATERYVFAYTITIENVGTVPAQLISRHWIITDGNSRVQEVRGLGVIGQQPLLNPGETFEYTSGCQLDTPVGTMRGSFQMTAEDGTQFDADIAEFTLSIPRVLH